MFKAKPSKEPLLNLDAEVGDSDDAAPPSNRVASRRKPRLTAEIDAAHVASSTPGRTAVPPGDAAEEIPKQGHKLFFVCCDTKRAVVWCNTLVFLLNVFTLTGAVMSDKARAEGYAQALIVRGCGMFVVLTTIFGAYTYSKGVVLVGLLFTCYHLTLAILHAAQYSWDGGYNEQGKLEVILPVLWNSLLFYAEGMFISEVNDGIMTKETYKTREKYICCCKW